MKEAVIQPNPLNDKNVKCLVNVGLSKEMYIVVIHMDVEELLSNIYQL